MPLVSVCIPTYNRSRMLKCAIESVLAQDFPDFEIIVCDDGSQDETPEMMRSLDDSRIRYIRHPHNIGKSNNMISGFEAAQGEYFIKFDDDDRLTPHFLSKTTTILQQHPEVDFVSTDHWVIDSNNRRDTAVTDANSERWGRTRLSAGIVPNLLETVFVQQSLQIGATLFRRQVLASVNYMRTDWQNCEDNDLLVRLALAGRQAYYLPERLMEYRFHAGQQGLHRNIQYLRDKLTYLQAYEFPTTQLETIRHQRLEQTQLLLGLRLIEAGQTQEGRALLKSGRAASPQKARIGLLFASAPSILRPFLFGLTRFLKTRSEVVLG